jgi:hypothetical protein
MATLRLFLASTLALCFCLASFVIAGTSSGHTGAQGRGVQSDSPAVQAARLVTRWTIIVTERFETSRAFKSDATDELVDQFISMGAVRAVEDKAGEDKLRAADAAIDRFAIAIIRAGNRREDGSVEVTDESVVAGRSAVCPIYPFC